MMSSARGLTHFRLGKWLVSPQQCRIEDADGSQRIEPKLMDVLVFLCERAGVVVSTEELLVALWRGTFYGDNPVHRSIALLRRALGDAANRPTHIATIRKRGYQIVGPVSFPAEYVPAANAIRAWAGGNPYPGLEPFRAEQQHIFFGRSNAQASLLSRLRPRLEQGRGFMLMLGPSGCGKSSLMQAGVVPLLRQAGGFDGMHALAVAELEPRRIAEDACGALVDTMMQWQVDGEPMFHALEREWLVDSLKNDRDAVRKSVGERLRRRTMSVRSRGYHPFLLLTLDHMERVFSEGGSSTRSIDSLFLMLTDLLEGGGIAMLAGCRNDFYPRLMLAPALVALKEEGGQYDLPPLSSGDIALTIRLPALAAGLTFEQDANSSLRLDDVLRDAAAHHPQSLPLLQHSLSLLYEQRTPEGMLTFAAYRNIGGIAGALAQHAEAAYALLPPSAQASLPEILRKLIALDEEGHSLVGREVPWPDESEIGADALVRCFIEQRLFVSELVSGCPTYSAAHESLFRNWPRISAWVDENRRILLQHSRLSLAHHRWIDEGERRDFLLPSGRQLDDALSLVADSRIDLSVDEHRFVEVSLHRSRYQRRLRLSAITAMMVLAALAGIAGILAMIQQREAIQLRLRAESLVGFMLGDLTESLRPIGKLGLLDAVSNEVSRYVSSIPTDPADLSAQLQREQALRQVGEIQLARGNTQGAADVFEQAALLARATATAHPDSADVWLSLGNAVFWQGQLQYRLGNYTGAEKNWNEYLYAARRLVALRAQDADAMLELSYAHNNLATLAFRQNRLADAKRDFAASLALKEQALAVTPDDAAMLADIADTQTWLGSVAEAEGDLEGAEVAYRGAVTMLGDLERLHPDDQRWRYRRAVASMHLASTLLSRGNLIDSESMSAQADDLLQALVVLDPSNVDWARDGVYATANLGWVKHLLGQQADATRLLSAALTRAQALVTTAGGDVEYRRLQAVVHLRAVNAKLAHPGSWLKTLSADVEQLSAIPMAWSGSAKTVRLLAEVLVTRGFAETAADQQRDIGAAISLLDRLESTSGNLAVIDLKVRALMLTGRSFEAVPQIERLLQAGYRNPAYDRFLHTQQKDNIWLLTQVHKQAQPRLLLN